MKSLPGVLGVVVTLLTVTIFAACASTEGPTQTPVPAACTDLSSVPSRAIFTPGPAPTPGLNSRELFLSASADEGALLLPYIEASGANSDYRATVTQTYKGLIAQTISVTSRVSGNERVFIENFEITLDQSDLVSMSDDALASIDLFNSMQMVGDESTTYARAAGFEKWVDVSDILGSPADEGRSVWLIRQDAPVRDILCDSLFGQASSPLSVEQLDSIEAETGVRPVLTFEESTTEDGEVKIEHESTVEYQQGEYASKTVATNVSFIANAETKLINRSVREVVTESSAFGLSDEESETIEVTIEYGPQDVALPSVEDGTLETDPDVIAEFLDLFNE